MDDSSDRSSPDQGETERLYANARALIPREQAGFVETACAGRPGLREVRAEVLSLLEHAEAAESFFARLQERIVSNPPWGEMGGADRLPGPTAAPDLPAGTRVGRYRIVERIGRGGMGTVYRAHDAALDRNVALKLLPPHLSDDPASRERFLIEARAVAALDHPNICTIHEVGETEDGRLFLAMARYEGETLKERLAPGPLPVGEAVAHTVQLARALGAAHAGGIVHRDVKPGNVMLLADGTVKLLDFGLARVADATLTRPGVTPGTVAYMSPEQARGDSLDHRTDLFSLGVVLYEMLAGVRPFRGGDDRAVLAAIEHEQPKPLASLRRDVPQSVTQIVARLLEKDPAARYDAADELLTALARPTAFLGGRRFQAFGSETLSAGERQRARLLAATLGLVGVVAVGYWFMGRGSAPPLSTGPPTGAERVLVVDFENFTTDPLLGDAVSTALRIDLARSPAFHVASAASVAGTLRRMLQDPGAHLDSQLAREVAVREGIRAVIDGEVRGSGAGYVVSAALVEAASGTVVDGWRESALDSAGLMDAIERLSATIRTGLGESLASLRAGEDLFPLTTASLEALRKHSQASRAYFRGDVIHAAALFEEAIRLDSTFAHAHVLLGVSLGNAGIGRGRSLLAYTDAHRFRDQLSPLERHAADGYYFGSVVGDLPRAVEAFRNQVEAAKAAGDVVMYATLGRLLAMAGDLAGAEAILREAREIYPTAVNQAQLVQVLYRRGKLAEAAVALEEASAAFPGHPVLSRVGTEMAAASGEYAAADSLADQLPFAAGIGAGPHRRALTAAVRGRFREAIDLLAVARQDLLLAGYAAEALRTTIASGRLHIAIGQQEAGLTEVERFLSRIPVDSLHPLDRPYLDLARLYAEAGDPLRAREFLMAHEREVSDLLRGADLRSYLQVRAAIHRSEGKVYDALADLELAKHTSPAMVQFVSFDPPLIRIDERPELARAYELAGHADSAIIVYERYLAAHDIRRTHLDAFELPNALLRLASLHDARNERTSAARLYLRFAELWSDADPELRPRAEAARRRAGELLEQRQPPGP
jgi:tetratricopeptide (TPR) repeat protein